MSVQGARRLAWLLVCTWLPPGLALRVGLKRGPSAEERTPSVSDGGNISTSSSSVVGVAWSGESTQNPASNGLAKFSVASAPSEAHSPPSGQTVANHGGPIGRFAGGRQRSQDEDEQRTVAAADGDTHPPILGPGGGEEVEHYVFIADAEGRIHVRADEASVKHSVASIDTQDSLPLSRGVDGSDNPVVRIGLMGKSEEDRLAGVDTEDHLLLLGRDGDGQAKHLFHITNAEQTPQDGSEQGNSKGSIAVINGGFHAPLWAGRVDDWSRIDARVGSAEASKQGRGDDAVVKRGMVGINGDMRLSLLGRVAANIGGPIMRFVDARDRAQDINENSTRSVEAIDGEGIAIPADQGVVQNQTGNPSLNNEVAAADNDESPARFEASQDCMEDRPDRGKSKRSLPAFDCVDRVQRTPAVGPAGAEAPPTKRPRSHMHEEVLGRLASLGPWELSKPTDQGEHRWLDVLGAAECLLGIKGGAPCTNGGGMRRLFMRGNQSSDGDFMIPCSDLRWDGRYWAGRLSRETASFGAARPAVDAFWKDLEQRVSDEDDGVMALLCLLIPDKAEDPRRVVWQITRLSGEAVFSVTFRRVDPSSSCRDDPPWVSETVPSFGLLARAGFWSPSDPTAVRRQLLFTSLRIAPLLFRFRKRRFRQDGRLTGIRFTFGMQPNNLNYALPCADLRWDGRSWTGSVTREAWRGDGDMMMDALWTDIEELMGEEASGDLSLQCVLTLDDVEGPNEVVWEIVCVGGGALLRLPLRRVLSKDVGNSADLAAGAFDASEHLERFGVPGVWTPLHPSAHEEHPWLEVARRLDLPFSFRVRHFQRDGNVLGRFLTFGAQSNRANYALPCNDLRWDGQSWSGSVTNEFWRSDGGAVMIAFWDDIKQRLGNDALGNASLQCVLAVDDVREPEEVVWQVGRPGEPAIFDLIFRRGVGQDGDHRSRNPELTAQFERLVRSGGWRPSAPNAQMPPHWFNVARTADLYLGFQLRHLALKDSQSDILFTFGAQSNTSSFALPCPDLRWDGHSWISTLAGSAWSGHGERVMRAFFGDVRRRLGKHHDRTTLLQCVLTVDDDESPRQVVWQIGRSNGEAIITVPLKRAGAGGIA
mmetsp:Transcript_57571/g.166603  ORF Transcript_57571/g.166603 Transcript_57571/m.166603 type:complete len:1100 (-) Transcript_57571:39-3338(-)